MLLVLLACAGCGGEAGLSEPEEEAAMSNEVDDPEYLEWAGRENVGVTGDSDARSDEEELWA